MSDSDTRQKSPAFAHLRHAAYENCIDLTDIPACVPWLGHTGFAHVLMAEYKPQTLVELGTFYGGSFFAFCQSVADNSLPTQCVAIDCWEGDEQAGYYGNEVYDFVKSRVDERYADFVTLKKMFFDAARADFSDESIDILHIDGLHTYEAVRHDFDTWVSAVRPGGIIIMHDVNEYNETFGACRVWDEVAIQTDEAHLFRHSHGLGVWRKPGGKPLESPLLAALLRKDSPESAWVDAYLTAIGERDFYRKRSVRLERLHAEALYAKDVCAQKVLEAEALAEQRSGDIQNLEHNFWDLEKRYASLAADYHTLENGHKDSERLRQEMERTLSWKITAPLRRLTAMMRGQK